MSTPRPESGSTPWQVICHEHGEVALTREEYDVQMRRPDCLWACPICGDASAWDDENYESHEGRNGISIIPDEDLPVREEIDLDDYHHFGPDE